MRFHWNRVGNAASLRSRRNSSLRRDVIRCGLLVAEFGKRICKVTVPDTLAGRGSFQSRAGARLFEVDDPGMRGTRPRKARKLFAGSVRAVAPTRLRP